MGAMTSAHAEFRCPPTSRTSSPLASVIVFAIGCRRLLCWGVAMGLLFLLLTAAVGGQSALDGFDPNANGPVQVVVLQPDGRILIGGDFTTLSPNGGPAVTRKRIARLNT